MAEQQALDSLTPPWTFKLAESAWGIDPSTKRIALGVVSGRSGPVSLSWDTLALAHFDPIGRKLNDARRRLVSWLEAKRDDEDYGSPSLVLVEEPFGGAGRPTPHPHAFFMVGLVLEALYEVLGISAPTYLVSPTSWKRPALGVGKGNAKKPMVLRWANTHLGYTGACPHCRGMLAKPVPKCGGEPAHDEADALGIAVAASMLLTERRG